MAYQTWINKRALAAAVSWIIFINVLMMGKEGNAERLLKDKNNPETELQPNMLLRISNFLWQSGKSSYEPIWPVSFVTSFNRKEIRFG